ncbi:MAG TPA: sigma-70 family RNA polymerase sigma factor [Alphaproteobacteria bacterium]|nr:sigma-70 family RNA polymerase sigma factor [Alphaproteobacteria bacterium]
MPPPATDPHSDQGWSRKMAAAQDGDRAAYDQLLREILPFLRAVVAGQHRRPDRIEDVVQDVLLTIHRVRHTYDPARPIRPWLAAIARRRSIDALRRRGRTEAMEVADDLAYETFADPAANRELEAAQNTAGLSGAIAGLPPSQREAVELLKLKEMSLAEASRASGKSTTALKVNVHRAIKALRAQLTGERK